MNEYCFQISATRTIWVCAIDEEEAAKASAVADLEPSEDAKN